MSVIATRALTKRYGRRVGVDGIELDVDAGTIFGFLGPNGAGKTTTIRLLLGFLRPSAGSAAIFGHDCWRHSARVKRDVGYLPGDLRLYPWLTGESAMRLSGWMRGRDLRDSGRTLGDRFRLDMHVRVRKMSRGMRQKLGLILALAHDPKLLVLDEPTSGLDPLMQDALADELRTRAANEVTVFFSSHTLSEVEQLCDRIAIVREGRIAADETLRDLRARARRAVTIEFRAGAKPQAAEAPEFLNVREESGAQWVCELTGAARELIEWAATQPIEDVTIGKPDLDRLFRDFYGNRESDR
jgi:ABC-2 type transport system ATP-binding protein